MKFTSHLFGEGASRGLWLHGWLGSGLEGEALQKALGSGFQLTCPDLPGHGETALGKWTLASTLEAIAEAAGKCDWAGGYSMGGRLLMMAAARYPEAFKHLILESASPGIADVSEREQRLRIDQARAESLKTQGLQAFCKDWYRMDMWGGFQNFPQRQGNAEKLAAALELFSVAHQPDLREWLQTAPHQILWLAGRKDPNYAHQAAWVKDHTLHQVKLLDTGHNLHAQDPHAWARKVRVFLSAPEPSGFLDS